jgi:Tfp pilus assembly protein PilO
MMKASTKRILSMFASFVGLFYALAAVLNSVMPGWGRLSALRAEIAEKEAARDRLQELVSQARNYLSQQGELERRAQPIDAALPTSPKIPELIAILSTLASKNGSVLSQVRFETSEYNAKVGAQQDGPAVSKVSVHANVVGTYPNIKAWLRDVEAELRLLDADMLNIQSTVGEQAATAETPMNVEIALTTYWQQ